MSAPQIDVVDAVQTIRSAVLAEVRTQAALDRLANPTRVCCDECGCLCLPDEQCPVCRVERASGKTIR